MSTYNQVNTWNSSIQPNFYDTAKFCKDVIKLNVIQSENIAVFIDSIRCQKFYDKYFKDSILLCNYFSKLVFLNSHLHRKDTFNLILESPESKIEFEKTLLEFSKLNYLNSKLKILVDPNTKSLFMFITYTMPMRSLKDLSIGYDFIYFKFISLVHN